MEKVYNKLVRDNIPNIIKNNGGEPFTRILTDEEYKIELEKKLYEEYNEVLNTKNTEERIEELADMIEIISSLALVEGKNLDVVLECARNKSIKRGGFKKKIYLEKVIED